jgi:hypothetical protein
MMNSLVFVVFSATFASSPADKEASQDCLRFAANARRLRLTADAVRVVRGARLKPQLLALPR